MTDKTMREKIAKDIDRILNHDFRAALSKASVLEGTDQYIAIGNAVREGTAAILAIPEIKEGQELIEKAESGKLVELDENQSWPGDPFYPIDKFRIRNYNQLCENSGFRRVKVKG